MIILKLILLILSIVYTLSVTVNVVRGNAIKGLTVIIWVTVVVIFLQLQIGLIN